MKSIIQTERECYICGRMTCLEEHHIFGASNREHSEEDGLKVWLCHWHHNEPPNGVHYKRELSLELRRIAQRKYEETHSREQFLARYGRNYL